ncbi:TetR/AcrR family transcriptional regulator [Nocardia sp. NPDC052112]|uniref:TetR/AcrR family transcriptional regulator n=1 Tax=Nocardia sp. NPDC052112 TaxID=3155646 RepID=UPI00341C0668
MIDTATALEPALSGSMRDRLIVATVQLISTEGLASLTVRRVARICGVSTMAIYSNFSGMPGLIQAVGSEGFAQLVARLGECEVADDPIAEILVLGFIFRDEALRKPELFRLMFATESPKAEVRVHRGNVLAGGSDSDFENFAESFDFVVRATRRALEANLLHSINERSAAAQFWTGLYGFIQLDMAGLYGDQGLSEVLLPSIVNILIGMGAERATVEQSLARALEHVAALTGPHP